MCTGANRLYNPTDSCKWNYKYKNVATKVEKSGAIFDASMEKRGSAELLSAEQSNSKNASSDSLNSDSKSSSLNSKMGQESV